jgi:hypothetical protein
VLRVPKAVKVLQVAKVLLVLPRILVQLVPKAFRVLQVLPSGQVPRVLRVLRALRVLRVLQVLPQILVLAV